MWEGGRVCSEGFRGGESIARGRGDSSGAAGGLLVGGVFGSLVALDGGDEVQQRMLARPSIWRPEAPTFVL